MTSWYHAKASAAKYGGTPEDYLDIHKFIDGSKAAMPDIRHRALLHSAWGIFIVKAVFGPTLNIGRKRVPVRPIAEEHIIQDLGFIPTAERWLKNLPIEEWMGGKRKRRVVPAFGSAK